MALPHPETPNPSAPRLLPRMFQQFFQTEAAGGILLLACAVIALVWANSPYGDAYFALWKTPLGFSLGPYAFSLSLGYWINDLLMAVFFFLVGLEIKRELLVGELSTPQKAILPVAAAIGAMIIPALIYTFFNGGTDAAHGWGIPMATDIAFSLGVLALLGSRVPVALKVFLTALAIADDMGAVLVIAIFYTSEISFVALGAAAVILAALLLMNRRGVHKPSAYIGVGLALWIAFLASGVHATIAGVLLAATIPVRRRIDAQGFAARAMSLMDLYMQREGADADPDLDEVQRDVVYTLEKNCEDVQSPLARLEHGLHSWVAFGIMPLFALANAGVAFSGNLGSMVGHHVTLGVGLGLIFGKQIGVTLFSFLSVKSGLARLPKGLQWKHIMGVSWLCGIGFTMSIFVAGLAFENPAFLDYAKVGIFGGSFVSGVGGYIILRSLGPGRA